MNRRRAPAVPRVGDSVLVRSIPEAARKLPVATRRAFRLAIGHQFKVRSRNRVGWLELYVGRVVSGISPYLESIWIEPACVRVVRRGKRAA
jgi:hypothetical protein